MRFYLISAIVTLIILITVISFRQDVWQTYALPYDEEQVGLNDQITINFSHVVAENTPKGLAADKFAQLVKEKSNGKINVQIYPNGILYNDENELAALKNGDIQMIAPTISKMTEALPSWQVLDLPFIFEREDQIYAALHGELSKTLLAELSSINVHGLSFWNNGFKQIASKNELIQTVEQFQYLTVRIMTSDLLSQQFNLLNAEPISTTFNDLYKKIQNNEILAQENTLSNLYSKGFYKMQPQITLSNHGLLAYSVLMNEDFWQSLDKSSQKIITQSLKEMDRWQHEQAIALNEQNLQQLQADPNVTLYTLSKQQREEWRVALQPIYQSYNNIGNPQFLAQLYQDIKN
ncbi:DctP family TRAP transporter solute-binding subunit [Solibacillus sp. FSL K6-1523]|uniref:DctP family TRAP transporter solute-binding subunit n=1 Tax=Solibacillus sp. FSL K6-1523 TaxID=2921471 RepID=UPI0030FB16E5